MDTTAKTALDDATLAKVPPVTGLEGDEEAAAHATAAADATDGAEVTDRELGGLPGDEPIAARFVDDPAGE